MLKPAIAIIQARMSSSRLPGKVLKPLVGMPMLWHIVERARTCQLVDKVIVATSIENSDDPIVEFCQQAGIHCHRGSLENVLERFLTILKRHDYPYFVRITGDCPLIHSPFIDQQIKILQQYDGDMIWGDYQSGLLEGQGVHSTRSLLDVEKNSTHPDDCEHVGSRYFSESQDRLRIVGLQLPEIFKDDHWRITVDEEADYRLMALLYEALWNQRPVLLQDAIDWLHAHPEFSQTNRQVQHSPINRELAEKRAQIPVNLTRIVAWDGH